MTGTEICENANKFVGKYVYWYGGKNQRCTTALLSQLSKLYPKIYTSAYKTKCRQHISAGKYCIDCSGLVCSVYGVGMVGTTQFSKYFQEYTGEIKNGMIVWTSGHTGIYWNGQVIEARGINYGVTNTRKYNASDWSKIWIMQGVEYDMSTKHTATDYLNTAINVIAGGYGTGEARKTSVTAAGYDYETVQSLVNTAMRGASK